MSSDVRENEALPVVAVFAKSGTSLIQEWPMHGVLNEYWLVVVLDLERGLALVFATGRLDAGNQNRCAADLWSNWS